MKQGDWRSGFGGRDNEFRFELTVSIVHPNGEVQWPPHAKALLMENGVTGRQVALGEPSENRSPGALRKAVFMFLVKEERVSSSLGIVQPQRPEAERTEGLSVFEQCSRSRWTRPWAV